MIELIQITNDPALARRCDALGGFRLLVDLERTGKAERQAGMNSFISEHRVGDVAAIRAVLRHSRLMVRVNPLHAASAAELDAVLAQGPDSVMLPMFTSAGQMRDFAALVAGRVPIVALLETAPAFDSMEDWLATRGLQEVFVGLNDLHLSLGQRFMFESLADGWVERVAQAAKRRELRFGFGGIARMEQGLLPGREVLAEHVRLGSNSVILSRAFGRGVSEAGFEAAVVELREEETRLRRRTPAEARADADRIALRIGEISASLAVTPG